MRIRERFKRFRGKVNDALSLENSPTVSTSSLPTTRTNPVTDPSLRAHSHPPIPRSSTQQISPHVQSHINNGGDKLQSLIPSDIIQAAHLSSPHTAPFARSPATRGVPSSTRHIIEPDAKADDKTIQAIRLLPETQASASAPNPIPTTILRLPDGGRNAVARLINSPLDPDAAEPTNNLALVSPTSLPTPNPISMPTRELQSDVLAGADEPQHSTTQNAYLLPTLRDSPPEAELAPRPLNVGEKNNEKPLDSTSLPQVTSKVADAPSSPNIELTCPKLDARVIPQVTTPMPESAHKNSGDLSFPTPLLPDSQTVLPTVTTSPGLAVTESGLSGPNGSATPTPAPTNAKSTLAGSAWKSFNGFRRVLGGIANEVGPLKLVMDQLGGLIDAYEDAANFRTDYTTLRNELEELFSILSAQFSGNVPPAMMAGMNNLCTAIEKELDQISAKEGRQMARRLLQADQDLDDVVRCYRRVKAHLERLKLNADLSMWKIVDEQATETRLKSLAPSLSAFYNSSAALQVGRRECTPETRQKVLASLSRWRHEKSQENIYWLNGMAGTGKTTIANSLCVMLDQSHELGASFFCTRLLPECRDVNAILPTVAYQLARFSRPYRYFLSQALEADPDLQAKALPNQLHGMIVGPLHKASPALPEDLVVVIDALDECSDSQAVSLLLEILVEHMPGLPLKVFVSSRPEPQIRHRIGDIKSKLILHELEAYIAEEDIRLYLRTELEGLSIITSDIDLSTLVERAGVLFIYAATVVRYVRAGNSPFRRQKRIQAIIAMDSQDPSQTNSVIDALYSAILVAAFDNSELDADEISNMKIVLDTVVCAQEPLTIKALTGLLGMETPGLVEDALEPLRSVLNVSGDDDLVNTLHASFPDYMLNPARSKQHGCQSQIHHRRLAEVCLDRIDRNECQFNICGLESSYLFDEEVSDLSKRVALAIPQDLWYACRYWSLHLKQGGPSAELLQRIPKFVKERLLLWMEVLNLKKHIHVGASIFENVERWCEVGEQGYTITRD